jgi:hypothetical protein
MSKKQRFMIPACLFFSYGELLHSLSDVPEFREFDPSSAAVQVHLKSQIKLKLFHFHLDSPIKLKTKLHNWLFINGIDVRFLCIIYKWKSCLIRIVNFHRKNEEKSCTDSLAMASSLKPRMNWPKIRFRTRATVFTQFTQNTHNTIY